MNKARYLILASLALLGFAAVLHAQGSGGGCDDSPEAATALLMLVGAAGMFCGSPVLSKVLRRNGKR